MSFVLALLLLRLLFLFIRDFGRNSSIVIEENENAAVKDPASYSLRSEGWRIEFWE